MMSFAPLKIQGQPLSNKGYVHQPLNTSISDFKPTIGNLFISADRESHPENIKNSQEGPHQQLWCCFTHLPCQICYLVHYLLRSHFPVTVDLPIQSPPFRGQPISLQPFLNFYNRSVGIEGYDSGLCDSISFSTPPSLTFPVPIQGLLSPEHTRTGNTNSCSCLCNRGGTVSPQRERILLKVFPYPQEKGKAFSYPRFQVLNIHTKKTRFRMVSLGTIPLSVDSNNLQVALDP